MSDTRVPQVEFAIPSKSAIKRQRPDSNLAVAIDTNVQVDRSKRQKTDDGDNIIDLTPSHRIPDVLGEAVVELVPTKSTEELQTSPPQAALREENSHPMPNSTGVQACRANNSGQSHPARSPPLTRHSNRSTLTPEPQSFSSPTAADQGPSNWAPREWDSDVFDTDSEAMSLAVMRKLVNEVSLLKSSLDDYKKFNIHLGDLVSGPRHKGFLNLIASSVKKMESYIDHLRTLRDDKQRGNPNPGLLENVANRIVRRFKSRRKYLWAVMEEKVDMEDHVARMEWVRKKRDVVGDVLGGVVGYLEELGHGEEWKEREVKVMAERWEKRWRAYGAMSKADLKAAGWILEVE